MNFSKGMKGFAREVLTGHSIEDASRRLVSFSAGINQAEKDQLFVLLSKVEPEKERNRSRLMTIRSRLFNLGYLKSDYKSNSLDNELKLAIRTFQKEAGLKIDGWVGEVTWTALHELVGFESSTNLPRWLGAGPMNPALNRAVALRLFVLGLLEKKPDYALADLKTGLNNFGHVWDLLGFGPDGGEAGLNLLWLSRLFDQDGLVKRLADISVPKRQAKYAMAHSFILNIAKVELWLAGYRVTPSGYDLKEKTGPRTKGSADKVDFSLGSSTLTQHFKIKKNLTFCRALNSFWRDHGRKKKIATQLSVTFLTFFPRFFTIIDRGLSAQTLMTEAEKEKKLAEIVEKNPAEIPAIWDNVRRFGSRIWDGIKRAWGWLKGVARKVKEIALNLSRLAYDFTLGAYAVVRNIFQSFTSTVQFLSKQYLTGSSVRTAIIAHDMDFDFRLFINDSAPEKDISELSAKLTRATRLFRFTCGLMGLLISIAITVFKRGVTGYLGLVTALLRFRRFWSRFHVLADQYREIFPVYA